MLANPSLDAFYKFRRRREVEPGNGCGYLIVDASLSQHPVRAQSIRARMSLMGLRVPTIAHWRADLEAELLRFPAGKHDDQVDALSLIGQLLDRVGSGTKRPEVPAKPKRQGMEGMTWNDIAPLREPSNGRIRLAPLSPVGA